MVLLFLDDMRERHDRFAEMAKDHEVWHVWNAEQAADRLLERVYDIAFLDHDLEDEHYAGYTSLKKGDGRDVARFIARMPAEKRPRCVHVHSWNTDAAEEMVKILTEAGVACGRAPFGSFTLEFLS